MIDRNIRDEYRLRSRQQRLRDAGMPTLDEMPASSASAGTVKAWHHAGLVSGQCYNDKGQALYRPTRTEPTPRTTDHPFSAGNLQKHRHPRTDPKRCSVKPKVSRAAPAGLHDAMRRWPDCVERRGELPGSVADQEPEAVGAVSQVHQQVADLLCGPRPVRVRGDPEDVHVRDPTSMTNRQYRRCRVTAQSTWKKSVASIVAA